MDFGVIGSIVAIVMLPYLWREYIAENEQKMATPPIEKESKKSCERPS